MATISSSNLQNIADNIAKIITDYNTNYVTNAGTNAPTTGTILTGVNGLAVSTTATTAVTATSPTISTIMPVSMSNIYPGTQLTLSGGTGGAETVTVLSTTSTTFSAVFVNTHSGTVTYTQTAASSSLTNRVQALTDLAQQAALDAGMTSSVTNAANWINSVGTLTNLYAQFTPIMNALDNHVGGLNAFLTTNAVQVQQYFGAAFNYFATNATGLGLRGSANAPTALVNTNVFPATNVLLGHIAVTGATAGTFTADSTINTALYSPLPIWIYKSNAGSSAAATAFSVTYTNAAGATATGTPAIAASMATGIGNAVTCSITGSAITNITVTANGTNAETYQFYTPLVRSVSY